jgi:hypothetical protein
MCTTNLYPSRTTPKPATQRRTTSNTTSGLPSQTLASQRSCRLCSRCSAWETPWSHSRCLTLMRSLGLTTVSLRLFFFFFSFLFFSDNNHHIRLHFCHHLLLVVVFPRSPLTTRHSPLTTYHSPLTTHHSPLTTHHSPLTTHHLSLTTHHSPPLRRWTPRPRQDPRHHGRGRHT